MTQQEKDELNKELCGLLWIEWWEEGTLGYHTNPDFTSEAGRVQLLKLMNEKDLLWKFVCSLPPNYGLFLYILEFMKDDNGAFAIAARDFLKAMEGK